MYYNKFMAKQTYTALNAPQLHEDFELLHMDIGARHAPRSKPPNNRYTQRTLDTHNWQYKAEALRI